MEKSVNVMKAGQVLTATVRDAVADARFDAHSAIVCETDDACANFPLHSIGTHALDENVPRNMTCFKGGQTVQKPQQMCDVTSGCLTKNSTHILTIAQTRRFWICSLGDHHRLLSAATPTIRLANSNFGSGRWSPSTALWTTARLPSIRVPVATRWTAKTSNAAV